MVSDYYARRVVTLLFVTFLNVVGADSCETSLTNITTGQLNAHQILTRPRLSIGIDLEEGERPDIAYKRSSLPYPYANNQSPYAICWICAGEAALYFFSQSKAEPRPPRYSVKYYYFFHLLEQVNYHLKSLAEIALARENLTPKKLKIEHGGSLQELLHLMTRYGLVPAESYGSTESADPKEIESYLRHLLAAAFARFKEVAKEAKAKDLDASKKVFEEKEMWVQNAIQTLEVLLGKLPLPTKILKASDSEIFAQFISSGSWTGFYTGFREIASGPDLIQGLPQGIIAHGLPKDLSLHYFQKRKVTEILEKIDHSLEQGLPVVITLRMRPGANLRTGHLHNSTLDQAATKFGWENLPEESLNDSYLAHFEATEQTHAVTLFDLGTDAKGKTFYHAMNSWGHLGDQGRLHIEEDYLRQYLIEAFIRTEAID